MSNLNDQTVGKLNIRDYTYYQHNMAKKVIDFIAGFLSTIVLFFAVMIPTHGTIPLLVLILSEVLLIFIYGLIFKKRRYLFYGSVWSIVVFAPILLFAVISTAGLR